MLSRSSSLNTKFPFFQAMASDSWAELDYGNGKKEKVEFYYGSGYLSQSTLSIWIPAAVSKIIVHDFKGSQRSVDFNKPALSIVEKNKVRSKTFQP